MPSDELKLDHIEHSITKIEGNIEKLTDSAKAHSEFVIESRQSLQHGLRTFEELRQRMSAAENQLRPNLSRIVTAVAALLVFVGTSVWALSLMFGERPTASQLKEILEIHGAAHHGVTAKKLESQEDKIQMHTNSLERINLVQDAIRSDVAEIKTDLKDMKRQRR